MRPQGTGSTWTSGARVRWVLMRAWTRAARTRQRPATHPTRAGGVSRATFALSRRTAGAPVSFPRTEEHAQEVLCPRRDSAATTRPPRTRAGLARRLARAHCRAAAPRRSVRARATPPLGRRCGAAAHSRDAYFTRLRCGSLLRVSPYRHARALAQKGDRGYAIMPLLGDTRFSTNYSRSRLNCRTHGRHPSRAKLRSAPHASFVARLYLLPRVAQRWVRLCLGNAHAVDDAP